MDQELRTIDSEVKGMDKKPTEYVIREGKNYGEYILILERIYVVIWNQIGQSTNLNFSTYSKTSYVFLSSSKKCE